jgi:hypothetical protein
MVHQNSCLRQVHLQFLTGFPSFYRQWRGHNHRGSLSPTQSMGLCEKMPMGANHKEADHSWIYGFSTSWAPMAHTYNPSYSEGRDQEDVGLRPAWANSFMRLYLKKTHHKKRAGGVRNGSRLRPWVQTPAPQKKTKTSLCKKDQRCANLPLEWGTHLWSEVIRQTQSMPPLDQEVTRNQIQHETDERTRWILKSLPTHMTKRNFSASP